MENKRNKVLHVIGTLGKGGAEKLLVDILNNQKENFILDLFVLSNTDNFYQKSIMTGVNIYVSEHGLYSIKTFLELKKYIEKNNYKIIHFHLTQALYYGYFLKKSNSLDIKTIYTEHSTNNKRRNIFFFKTIEKRIYASYNHVICISKGVKDRLFEWLDIGYSDDYSVIKNGINYLKYKDATPINLDLYNIDNESFIITMVSRFNEAKDHLTLIRAINEIKSLDIKLLLIGDGDNEKVRKTVEKLDLESKVYFLGFVENVERFIKASDIIVQSSLWEGFGLAALEGMAAGKPVISTNVDGLKELYDDETFLFEVGDYNKLSSIIEDIINHPHRYIQKTKEYQEKAKKYSIDQYVYSLDKIYMSILENKLQ